MKNKLEALLERESAYVEIEWFSSLPGLGRTALFDIEQKKELPIDRFEDSCFLSLRNSN